MAKEFGVREFGVRVPSFINNVISQKNFGNNERANLVLTGTDWSESIPDFMLADAVLREKYGEAHDVMIRLGKEGGLVDENAYHEWPLFNQFRESDEFMKGYEAVFGYTFFSEAKRTTEDKKLEVESETASVEGEKA